VLVLELLMLFVAVGEPVMVLLARPLFVGLGVCVVVFVVLVEAVPVGVLGRVRVIRGLAVDVWL